MSEEVNLPPDNHRPTKTTSETMDATTVNVSMPTADTEYSYALPTWTKKFMLKLRSETADTKLNVGSTPAQSGVNYVTVPAGSQYHEEGLRTQEGQTLYFQSPVAAQVAEIIIWR